MNKMKHAILGFSHMVLLVGLMSLYFMTKPIEWTLINDILIVASIWASVMISMNVSFLLVDILEKLKEGSE